MTHDKLLKRLRALYAMAKETEASPHEAEIALRRAEALTREHGVTEADLETEQVQMEPIIESADGRPLAPWQVTLASVAAEVHECEALGSIDATVSGAVGLALDIAAARVTFDYLVETLERGVAQWRDAPPPTLGLVEEMSRTFDPFEYGGDSCDPEADYRDGFARGIIAAWRAVRAAREFEERQARAEGAGASAGGALVVKKAAMIEERLEGMTTERRDPLPLRPPTAAALDGARDGAKVSLARQVEGA